MIFRRNFSLSKARKMAECFFPTRTLAIPRIFVLSKLPDLSDQLLCKFASKKRNDITLPDMFLKNVQVSDTSEIAEEHISSIKEAEIVVCDVDVLIKAHKYMPNLKWVHCTFAGVEPLFKALSKKPPFTITRHGGDGFCNLMAEYVMCQILNCERKFKECWKNQESKTWMGESNFSHRSLDQLTVAILGAGNMGTAIARFLKERGSTVYGFTRRERPPHLYDVFDKMSHDLVSIIKDCDYLCITLPSTPLTNKILNTEILKKCHKSPVLINVGRGSIISEEDIVQSIRNGYLSGAVLDVFEEEPLPASSQLWEIPEVTITPHIAAISKSEHVAEEFVKNFFQYTDTQTLSNVVNWSAGY